MARHSSDRKGQIQTEAPRAQPVAAAPEPTAPAPANAALPWGWQVALFVWLASFVFLFLNDLLACIFKLASRGGG
jgi:hypothetical protein